MVDFDDQVGELDEIELATFGRPCTFHGAGLPDVSTVEGGGPLLGIFDPHYLLAEVTEDGEPEVQSTAPAVWVVFDHLQLPSGRTIEEGDEITVDGTRWGIQRDENDHVGPGHNLVLFELPA